MTRVVKDYAKYENYIRVGHSSDGSDLQNFPTPSSLSRSLYDQDVDAYTDLKGYTHRNRVRHDIEGIDLSYEVLSDADEEYILNRISPAWIYIELIDKKTGQKKLHKMYASDKKWDTFRIWKDDNGDWHTEDCAFSVSFVEQ